ncbi:peptidylprolyl isomerase [Streptomyces aidingensis]|uniref:Peptidyl-prolyl cis-trans isomerase n=1 Tax=Streptomyces aidingensis TaxID=910347 RepID=A0A1I1RMB2_9ACTN|nr:peptidyl-prolyl cis-trans isomerase A (cyclophilin A) [Streptomyces aidingensis]
MSARRRLLSPVFTVLLSVGLVTACSGDGDSSGPAATQATIHTSMGDIAVELFPEQAPLTVENFTGLATGDKEWEGQEGDEPLYDGTIFHRVIADFMIQGGDPQGTGAGGPGYQFEDEFDPELTFDRPYLLAMANSGPNTNGSQFFITVVPTPHLDQKHTIFGEVADEDSQAVVDAIATVDTDATDRPVEDVVIENITVE